jgi:hypothetical protein
MALDREQPGRAARAAHHQLGTDMDDEKNPALPTVGPVRRRSFILKSSPFDHFAFALVLLPIAVAVLGGLFLWLKASLR